MNRPTIPPGVRQLHLSSAAMYWLRPLKRSAPYVLQALAALQLFFCGVALMQDRPVRFIFSSLIAIFTLAMGNRMLIARKKAYVDISPSRARSIGESLIAAADEAEADDR